MKAFILDRYGSADRVRAGDAPDPQLREDGVVVENSRRWCEPLDCKRRGLVRSRQQCIVTAEAALRLAN